MSVPYTFASATGNINLAQLDANFANLSAGVGNANYATLAAAAIYVTSAAQPNVTSLGTLVSLNVSGNVITGNIKASGYYYANGQPFSGASTYGNTNVAAYLPTYTGALPNLTGVVSTTGTISGVALSATGSIRGSSLRIGSTNIDANGLVTASLTGTNINANLLNANNITTSGSISAFGNLQGANIAAIGTISTLGSIVGAVVRATGQITTSGRINADGNIQTGSNLAVNGSTIVVGNVISTSGYFIGDGSLLTNLPGGGGSNYGNANVADYLPTYSGNLKGLSLSLGGPAYVTTISASGNIVTTGMLVSNNKFAMVSAIQRTTYVSNVAPAPGQGAPGDIWYQTY